MKVKGIGSTEIARALGIARASVYREPGNDGGPMIKPDIDALGVCEITLEVHYPNLAERAG